MNAVVVRKLSEVVGLSEDIIEEVYHIQMIQSKKQVTLFKVKNVICLAENTHVE